MLLCNLNCTKILKYVTISLKINNVWIEQLPGRNALYKTIKVFFQATLRKYTTTGAVPIYHGCSTSISNISNVPNYVKIKCTKCTKDTITSQYLYFCERYSANIQPILRKCISIVSALYQMQRNYDTAPISIL